MKNYNFDKITDRTGIDSLKWDVKKNELPMWVADMDFEVCPEIINALKNRLNKPTLGYNIISDDWYKAYINWWKVNHNFTIKKDWLLFSTGVVPSISSIVRRLTLPAEKVLIMTPIYNIFFNSILNNGRVVKDSPLKYENNEYSIDFERLDRDLSDPQVKLMIFCNPHNPIGKNWDLETLQKIGDLCAKHHVIVISDEIHCDIQLDGNKYIPFAKASNICKNISITCLAPTKAFNIAGLQTSALVIPSKFLRHTVNRGINNDEIAEPNSFALISTISAFNHGKTWLDEMNKYISENRLLVKEFLTTKIDKIKLINSEATYLLWIDCSKVCNDSVDLTKFIREKTGLYVSDGLEYGKVGKCFIRMNIACPKARVIDALERLKTGIELYLNH